MPHDKRLSPVLGLLSATAIVVGTVIGSGIFFKPTQVARAIGGEQVGLILLLWIVCGLVNLCGALTQAELSAMYPHAGGIYVFLREAYGRFWAFLWAWAEFWVIRTGSTAALAVYSAMGVRAMLPLPEGAADPTVETSLLKVIAVVLIGLFGLVNAAGIYWGGAVQNLMTAIKVATVATICTMPFVVFAGRPPQFATLWPGMGDAGVLTGIGAALAAIMWAYDGWGNVTVVAEEIHNPQRNVPRALILGVLILIVLYVGANLAYHWVLPLQAIVDPKPGDSAATELWRMAWPSFGAQALTALVLVSTLGALNGNVLVGPRVLFALSRDHRPIERVSRLDSRGTPLVSVLLVSAWSAMLVLLLGELEPNSRTPLCDVLTNYCIFGGSIFYLMSVLAVFVLRSTRPDVPRPYRTWGYPFVPVVFVAFYLFLLGSMFYERPVECLAGLSLIAAGAVTYAAVFRFRGATSE